ncbi:GIY-YIG nuclease family protein [Vibrio parahaemolyticus]|uniref:competence protein CoiA family protein n=1 Tax=Vibrio parahaemolyticus TaxID=670 RepID=UPI00040CC0D7|nr:GIY-YIG nuclease family protein [Vibrio parahaemolyticus]EIE1316450.1 GIY-YIG nuclease family protein [Vibrio parahaemolyticus]EJC6878630.1 GIY-YIG nuclease family protein [Vibrio parahaemolyticus]EJC6888133.1 GIY-YIG nuclease family protein [Vibrio parahaemolyticus]MCS0086475.1 GIY-YIG nuclease family protein [Vibrio parahaemolyticus]MCW7949001.1 hypothetical protein [Vibrio parahaemolyticus]
MFLSHGLNDNGELIGIHEVQAGRTSLRCPFCQQGLIAKKGRLKEHHFAHDGQTCADAKVTLQMTGLPLFDVVTGVSKAEMTMLEKLSRWHSFSRTWLSRKQQVTFDELVISGLVEQKTKDECPTLSVAARQLITLNSKGGRHLSMADYAELQETLFAAKDKQLLAYDQVHGTQTSKFFRLRLATILQQHLYVLRIHLELEGVCYPLYKVGMTTRRLEERMLEIGHDLAKFGCVHDIKVIGFYPHFGSLEKRVLARLQAYQHKFGSLTEYSDALSVNAHLFNQELRNLGKRRVDGHEYSVSYRRHHEKVKSGQRRAQFIHSRHLGRPTKESETLLNDYPDVIRAYHNGLSLRKASAETGRAINTVRKVYDVINAKVGRK